MPNKVFVVGVGMTKFEKPGRWVVNPSGGLISKGHPLGATGLAQCAELTWQLRGTADKRQVDGVTAALQHNIGLPARRTLNPCPRAPQPLASRRKRPSIAAIEGHLCLLAGYVCSREMVTTS
jgi:hypothetical protein